MHKFTFYIILISLVLSCTSNTIYDKPDDLIEKEKMIELITQIQLANGARSSKNKNGVRKIEYMSLVYKNFGVDSAQFAESNLYYSSKIDEYAEIFKRVQDNLDALVEEYEQKRIIRDSIKNLERDELRKKNKKNREKSDFIQPKDVEK